LILRIVTRCAEGRVVGDRPRRPC